MYLKRGSRAEFVSEAISDDFLAIGSSPRLGDIGATGVSIPAAPSAPGNRYLIRLCGFDIPGGFTARICGIRQLITLRAEVVIVEESPPSEEFQAPIQIEQESPLWTFPDGNVSWHLVQVPDDAFKNNYDPVQVSGRSPVMNALSSAEIYVPGTTPKSVVPFGTPVANLGTWRDLRYPWSNNQWTLDNRVVGPGKVILYASVKQTNPETRPVRRSPLDLGAIQREDRFLLEYPDSARYGRVAGALMVEFDGGPP